MLWLAAARQKIPLNLAPFLLLNPVHFSSRSIHWRSSLELQKMIVTSWRRCFWAKTSDSHPVPNVEHRALESPIVSCPFPLSTKTWPSTVFGWKVKTRRQFISRRLFRFDQMGQSELLIWLYGPMGASHLVKTKQTLNDELPLGEIIG